MNTPFSLLQRMLLKRTFRTRPSFVSFVRGIAVT